MSDREYRKEFITVASTTLVSGFLTVFSTISYQVILLNGQLERTTQVINAIWAGSSILFFTYNLLFIVVSFVFFFANTDRKKSEVVHEGEIGPKARK